MEVLTPPGLYGGGYGAAGIEARAAAADVYNSPGWKRMQARAGERAHPRGITIDSQVVSSHSLGDRVFHQKFGYGAVIGLDGDKLEIDFEKTGVKHVVARFVTGADDIPF